VKVRVSFTGHVVVENNVNLFDIDATTEDFSGDEDAVLKLLEAVVDFDSNTLVNRKFLPLSLWDVSVDGFAGNGVFVKDFG